MTVTPADGTLASGQSTTVTLSVSGMGPAGVRTLSWVAVAATTVAAAARHAPTASSP